LNAGHAAQLVLQVGGWLARTLLVVTGVRAIISGEVKSPKRIVYGTPLGVVLIRRGERPLAFWSCVVSFLGFGLAIVAAAWLVT